MKFSNQQIRELLGQIPYPTIVVDAEGQIVLTNPLTRPVFGYGKNQLIGQPVEILVPIRHQAQHVQQRANYMADPQIRPMAARLKLTALHRDGHDIPVEIALSPLTFDDQLHVLAVIHDISLLKKEQERLRHSRQQMRALSNRLLLVREEERTRAARLVHDELGQLLTGLKMDLAWLHKRLDHDQEPLLEKTEAMAALIDDAVQAVRRLAIELRPGILDDLGLEAAVEWQLQEFQQRTEIRYTLTSNLQEDSPDTGLTTCAFRILQEALTNVARHAQASRVEVVLTNSDTGLTLMVRDDGRGISDDELNAPTSIGLLGMQETARMHEGQLDIQVSPGQGTTVILRLPWTNDPGEVS